MDHGSRVKPANEAVADLQKCLLSTMRENETGTGVRAAVTLPAMGAGKQGSGLRAPGGFRRHFLHQVAEENGIPLEARPKAWNRPMMETLGPLIRVGYFDSIMGMRFDSETGAELHDAPAPGHSGLGMTMLALVKSFVGPGLTFIPQAFMQGGWLFSPIALILVAILSLICIRLLLDCREQTGLTSFADVAREATGAWGCGLLQVALVLSQFGTCVAYIVFVAKLSGTLGFGPPEMVVAVQLVALVPLSLIRSVHRLEKPNLVADALIGGGLVVAVCFFWESVAMGGGFQARLSTIAEFKPATCGILLGTVIFTFEGIPLILPIREAMKEPERFWSLFLGVFAGIVGFFAFFGLLGYAAYGDEVSSPVLMDLPPDSGPSVVVRIAYMIAILAGMPLMFLPAARITEFWVFGAVAPGTRKWEKNALRSAEVCLFAVAAVYGGPQFEKVLAIIGAVCCAPIAFIFPPLFHLRLSARSLAQKVLDVCLLAVGFAAMGFAVAQTLE